MKTIILSLCLLLYGFTGFSQSVDTGSIAADYTESPSEKPVENNYVQGKIDAERHYKKYKGAGTGTLITSLVSPLVGLIPAIACSASAPKLANLGYPDENQFKNQEYHLGYTEKAKKIKKKKVWTNWGIGFGVNLVAVLLIASGASN